MHQLVPQKIKLIIVIAVYAAVTAIISLFTFKGPVFFSVVALTEVVIIFLMLNSWSLLQKHLPQFFKPKWLSIDLNGKWAGNLVSEYCSDEGPSSKEPIVCTLTISQDWQKVFFVLDTKKMTGTSENSFIVYDADLKELRIKYFYTTSPIMGEIDYNPPQRLAAAVAKINILEPDKMQISYINDRGSRGEITLSRCPDGSV